MVIWVVCVGVRGAVSGVLGKQVDDVGQLTKVPVFFIEGSVSKVLLDCRRPSCLVRRVGGLLALTVVRVEGLPIPQIWPRGSLFMPPPYLSGRRRV